MKLNFNQQILNLDEKPLMNADGSPVTMAYAAKEALLAIFPTEKEISGDEKFKRYQLAKKINSSSEECEISIEEAALIKKLVSMAYGANVVGRLYEMMEK